MTRRRATLRDVAQAVGVHVSTVSRALDPKTRGLITDELADRILSTARELDYRPNSIAHSLRTRRSRTIGVLVPDINNPIFPPIIRGLEDVLVPEGYAALVVNTDGDSGKASRAIDMLRSRGVDGLVVASAEREDSSLIAAHDDHLPIVTVNRMAEKPALSAVVNDEVAGIGAVIDHLVGLGHKRIAHIAGPARLSTGAARSQAFRACIAARGLDADPDLFVQSEGFTEAEGARCMRALLARKAGATAVIAANDLLALGAIAALREAGLECPADVSVTGYNDMPFVDRLLPPLTTVRIRSYETGRRAAERILEEISLAPGAPEPRVEVLPVELVVRGSTGAAPTSR